MRVVLDTSVLVDVERKRAGAVDLLEKLSGADHRVGISIVSVVEVLMGANLRRDADEAILRAKAALGQFEWIDLDGRTAERAAQLLAYLRVGGKPVGFQDSVIAAAAIEYGGEALVTGNKDHFERFPPLKGKVFTPKEFARRLRPA